MKRAILLSILVVVFLSKATAQFTLSGELRPRLELRHGYGKLPTEDSLTAAFVNQRSRLNMLYENEHFNTFISFQDVRTWGGKGMFEIEPGMGIHQAYAEIFFLNSFSVKAGRQELRYNNQRLFGVNNWNQAGRTHDAAVLKFEKEGWKVHTGGAFNQTDARTFGTEYLGKEYKSLNFLWVDKKIGNFNISALAVVDGYQGKGADTTTQFRSTFGGVLSWKPGSSVIELHGYKQGGKTAEGREIDAWYASLAGRFKPAEKLNLNIGAEIFSGNNKTRDEAKLKAFNPMYGANHAFNGHLDYFTNIPAHTKEGGLVNPYINLVYNLKETINLKADYHYFALQNKLVDENNHVIDRYLGSEIDLSLQYFISKQADVQFGYSTMFATKSMEFLKGGSYKEPIHWGWVMLTVKPVFFTTRN